ncbi:MFS transporter [Staphylococcus ursi]|uniref:MFS transporter n=1 Tax=Staphylococcus sp. MI 10-1553 TaxID=1912064 RepID=UPI001396F406|nr:MFS transporter [Staphylococcus sp. MI 10-1553]QHW37056.1 MFS transporter [Staphylococcus sp. MI 10-1553]
MKMNIIKFVTNDFLVGLGSSIFNLAIMWYTLEKTGSAFHTALIGSLSHIAQISVGSYAGIKADQFNQPIRMMKYSLRINSLVLLLICILIGTSEINIFILIFLLLIREIVMVFQFPNQNKLIPKLSYSRENVKRILSYRSLTKSVSMMIGFSMAGILFAKIPFLWLLSSIIIIFLISSVIISQINISQNENFKETHLNKSTNKEQFLMTLEMILSDYYLKRVLISSIFLNVISMVAPTFIVYFNQYLEANSSDYGMFQFLIALGSILAATLGIKMKKVIPPYSILLSFWLAMSITFIYMYINSSIHFAIMLGVIIGVCLTLPNILFSTYKIVIIEDEYRGRISGMIQSISTIFIPFSYYFSAYVSDYFGANVVFLIAGLMQLFILAMLLFDKKLRVNFNKMV